MHVRRPLSISSRVFSYAATTAFASVVAAGAIVPTSAGVSVDATTTSTDPANQITITPASASAHPGSVLPISGTCGDGFDAGTAAVALMPYNEDANGWLDLPINDAGEFRGGLVIPPSEPIGEKWFAVTCYQPGAHAGLGLSGVVPFEIVGAPVQGLLVRAVPSSGSAGTQVSLSGSGCILDGEPLANARVTVAFVTGGPSVHFELSASIDGSGNWATEFTVPTNVTTAQVTILTLVCDAPDARIGNFKSTTIFAIEPVSPPNPASTRGYLLAAADGGVFAFGRPFLGSAASLPLDAPVVDIASTPSGNGYWLAAADGGIFSFGDAQFYGSLSGISLDGPVVAIVATPDGRGYWLAAADGGVFAFGDAPFEGGPAPAQLEAPVVAMARTADGAGYSLLTGSGQVFALGSALEAYAPRQPVRNGGYVGMTEVPGTDYGLWLVEAGGYQVLSNAGVEPPPSDCGPLPGDALVLRAPVVDVAGIEPFEECRRWLAAADGGVFSYRAPFLGSMGNVVLAAPVVAITA